MEIIYLLLAIALILVGIMLWVFFWAVKSDQFEDLEGPAHRIIQDQDKIRDDTEPTQNEKPES